MKGKRMCTTWKWAWVLGLSNVVLFGLATSGDAACGYFAAKTADIKQPSQKVFITWDPVRKIETFTVQPKFEGDAGDFGMVIPTPSRPVLHEMPRAFFRHLAVYTLLYRRERPYSNLLAALNQPGFNGIGLGGGLGGGFGIGGGLAVAMGGLAGAAPKPRKPAVKVVERGLVGSLDYKIIEAGRADDLHQWLKDHKYNFAGDEATLDYYVKKKWLFTVMKIDTLQMKRRKDGTYAGEVTPTRFAFRSDKLVYPLKITQVSVQDQTEALFYVQAPYKVDLKGAKSYQFTWLSMLRFVVGRDMPKSCIRWREQMLEHRPELHEEMKKYGYAFVRGVGPKANKKGHTPTTVEWAKRLTPWDIQVLRGKARFSETVPNVDNGFKLAQLRNPKTRLKAIRTIQARLVLSRRLRPYGYLVRRAPKKEREQLRHLVGHLQPGMFLIKFRKTFKKDEMNEDLLLVPAERHGVCDWSEYTYGLRGPVLSFALPE